MAQPVPTLYKYSVLTALETEKSMFHALFSSALDFFGKANCKGVAVLASGLYMPVAVKPFRPKKKETLDKKWLNLFINQDNWKTPINM
jgi:hypothetical protein